MNCLAVEDVSGNPFAGAFFPNDAMMTMRIDRPRASTVKRIQTLANDPQIGSAIVEPVVVYVVNDRAIGRAKYEAMKIYRSARRPLGVAANVHEIRVSAPSVPASRMREEQWQIGSVNQAFKILTIPSAQQDCNNVTANFVTVWTRIAVFPSAPESWTMDVTS